jgi:hypothetical protein
MQLSHTQTPPGGWQWYSPQTRWNLPNPVSVTFDQAVTLIIKHRLANAATTVQFKLATDFNAVAAELDSFTRSRLGMPAISFPKQTPPPAVPQLSGAVQSAVAVVKKIAAGAALLLEWEQSGKPAVAPELSQKRADICATCPKNEPGKGLTDYFTAEASEQIRKRFARLMSMNLTTTKDAELKVCSACLCPLRLKVHTPLELIVNRLKPEQRAELDPRCWILAGIGLDIS